jgi:hypothetical protein
LRHLLQLPLYYNNLTGKIGAKKSQTDGVFFLLLAKSRQKREIENEK